MTRVIATGEYRFRVLPTVGDDAQLDRVRWFTTEAEAERHAREVLREDPNVRSVHVLQEVQLEVDWSVMWEPHADGFLDDPSQPLMLEG